MADAVFVDQLKTAVSLADVIGRDHKLHPTGRNRYKVRCPFHAEKTPSCHLDDLKGLYHCFGCGVSGDVIAYVQARDNLSFKDAVKLLADGVGLSVPRPSQAQQHSRRERQDAGAILQLAQQWFASRLASSQGSLARDYLRARGIDNATAKIFGLGFAPDSPRGIAPLTSALMTHADLSMLRRLGLTLEERSQTDLPRDFFRDRLMFPIHDKQGTLVGFGGRTLQDTPKVPKYLNTRTTEFFSKGQTVYNLHRAQKTESETLLVVEGYTDVLALHRCGWDCSVAPLGTATTVDHWRQMLRAASSLTFMFDGDQAGREAVFRAIQIGLPLLTPSLDVRVVLLDQAEDPDHLVRHRGATGVRAALESSVSFPDFLWQKVCAQWGSRVAPPSAQQRARIEQSLIDLYSTVEHAVLRRHLLGDVRDRLWQWSRGQKSSLTAIPQISQMQAVSASLRWQVLLVILLDWPSLAAQWAEPLVHLDWPESLSPVVQALFEFVSQQDYPPPFECDSDDPQAVIQTQRERLQEALSLSEPVRHLLQTEIVREARMIASDDDSWSPEEELVSTPEDFVRQRWQRAQARLLEVMNLEHTEALTRQLKDKAHETHSDHVTQWRQVNALVRELTITEGKVRRPF